MEIEERRRQKGRMIVKRSKIKKVDNTWRVPSQTRHFYYIVKYDRLDEELSCTCSDYKETLEDCKHIFSVKHLEGMEIIEEKNETIKETYSQNWKAYDLSQTKEKTIFLEMLNDLCKGIPNPEYTFGRPRLALGDMIFSSALKVYSTFSLRRFTSDMQIAKEKDFIDRVPHYSSVALYMENPELTPLILDLIKITSLPLKTIETDFAIDSSGFSTSQFGRWFDFRYGKDKETRIWIKAHICVGTKTNIITSLKVTHGYSSDSKEFSGLVEETAQNFHIKEVSADKAYLSKDNLNTVAAHNGTAYIPFKSNSSGRAQKARIWKKMYHYFMYNHEEFLKHYHKRSNVETAFHMIKAKFGSHIRSKTETAQVNEVLLKVLCHNICVLIQEMHELGIDPFECINEIQRIDQCE